MEVNSGPPSPPRTFRTRYISDRHRARQARFSPAENRQPPLTSTFRAGLTALMRRFRFHPRSFHSGEGTCPKGLVTEANPVPRAFASHPAFMRLPRTTHLRLRAKPDKCRDAGMVSNR